MTREIHYRQYALNRWNVSQLRRRMPMMFSSPSLFQNQFMTMLPLVPVGMAIGESRCPCAIFLGTGESGAHSEKSLT